MSYKFEIESEHFTKNELCNRIEIEISISAQRHDYQWEIESIYDLDADCERKLEDFTEKEQAFIDARAEKCAYDNSSDAYQDAIEAAGDRAYDEWKDRQMEEGE